jgi:hypothetical protein
MSRTTIQHDVAMSVHGLMSALYRVEDMQRNSPTLMQNEVKDIVAAFRRLGALIDRIAKQAA